MAEGSTDRWVIDVSRWQGDIDWPKVAAAGVQGAWIKVGGSDGGFYRDSKAATNLAGAESVMPFGTYYYAVPRRGDAADAYAQAEHAVSVGYGAGQMWPVLDLEDNPNALNGRQLDCWVVDFCARAMELTGRESVLYTGFYDGIGYQEKGHPHCPLWIANYGSNKPGTTPPSWDPAVPPAWDDWSAWQFNSVTSVPGIVGNVDQNTVKGAFWDQMIGNDEMEDDMAMTGIVRTMVGSEWALEHVGRNDVAAYILTIEGSRTCRWLDGATLDIELFWAGKTVGDVWEVEDAFLAWPRYRYEASEDQAAGGSGRVSGTITGAFQTA